MRFKGLDLNLLVALDAVMTARNLTAAARKINLSQPAMSAAIARLRTYFRDELFTMRGRELVPTPGAEALAGPVREALLILERRHLIAILPRRGAHVTELTEHNVRSLCTLMSELYILLGNAVAHGWRDSADMAPFVQIQQRLKEAFARQDIRTFVDESFSVMRAAYPFANNPYLQETVENLQPAMSRAYFLALEQRKAEMSEFLDLFQRLLVAVLARDLPQIRIVLTAYCQRSCDLVVAALTKA